MIYIKKLILPTLNSDRTESYLLYTHKSAYPFHVLSFRGLFEVDFSDITIISGGNGTGKSTLLNIIAQKLKLRRPTPFNRTEFFDEYLGKCRIEKSMTALQLSANISDYGRIITSDEVFDYMIETRLKNDEIDDKRNSMRREIERLKNEAMPRHIDLEDPTSIEAYSHQLEAKKKTKSRYIKENLGFNVTEYSNGENGFRFFTETIKPYGLYILDEPENSLEAERQLDLADYISSMAQYERCQFIISTHSPFIMSIPEAKLYNLDINPAAIIPWTEVKAVRIYHDFFEKHRTEF